MILQLIVLTLIILIALFLANEGALSAILLLFAAVFASTLTMGIYEIAAQPLLGWQPDYARGLAFLLIFFLSFSAIRFLFDYLIRGDINLPLLPGRIIGGAVGFFAALVIVGTTLIGIDMLPLPTTILGYNRYPTSSGMAGKPAGMWLAPDSFTSWIWSHLSGGAWGGSVPFVQIHPNILRELYGYRHTVQYAGRKALSPNLLTVLAASRVPLKTISALGIPNPGAYHYILVVRSKVRRGSKPPDISDDEGYFRLTPTEVRLVTTHQRQYYPIGYLKFGKRFRALQLHSPIVDDYRSVGGHHVVIQNWVFRIKDNESPLVFEIKSTARVDFQQVAISKKLAPLLAADYPQLPYNRAALKLTLSLHAPPGPVHLWILRATTDLSHVRNAVQQAYRRLGRIAQAVQGHQPVWSTAVRRTIGNPSAANALQYRSIANAMVGQTGHFTESWTELVPVLLASQVGHNTTECMSRLHHYLQITLKPLMKRDQIAALTPAVSSPGQPLTIRVAPGNYALVAWSSSTAGMRVWVSQAQVEPNGSTSALLNDSQLVVSYQLGK
jgi:hypothetical protein